ncbi:MAG: DnaJ domain-containing protein [gamma proteobacterium symbiont of Bathyaustriella thionipta]|nr:DnaJ domain-containing protein [gamma proteobacterium symbiont of Bathyaustriella thionipta]MCU7948929.1 DnaJ domain-containing protein [gamma proteobacterium symbiont of Bathyaustriella thionipta]MCU7954318.1 DnaJ domain-containing protein [gamma proteobacterium symbiont of Bathyaustriella thionipta]MCU7955636.1 DnaJ domain-containing protein [gamma proteobacterium symbiont of Bathyaustriella thionipta]MCU7966630.1 DnaJ domain-containing protein [gamma proteobacterium symbiont of Bathyaustr
MSQKDYYKILGVKRSASDSDIKKQYRRLARKYHPDVSKVKNSEERFKEINEAYDVLKDKEKRSNYDRFGSADGNPFSGGGFTPPPGGGRSSNFGGFGQGSFNDIFDSMFTNSQGGQFTGQEDTFTRQQRRRPQKGQDQTVSISVDLEDSYKGAERSLHVHIPGTSGTKKLKVKIPKGIKEGQKIRLSGQGGSGPTNGDLFLEVKFNRHKYFTIDGKDINLVLPITPWEAALGTKLSIPTLGGTVEMKLAAKTPGGKKLRLKGRGLPGKDTGDQFVVLQIMTPDANTEALKELYEKMSELSQYNPRENY